MSLIIDCACTIFLPQLLLSIIDFLSPATNTNTLFEIFIFCPKIQLWFPEKNCRLLWVKNSWKCCGFGLFSCWQLWFHEKNCPKKIWVKNSRKCWGFVKIEFLDKNLTFRIVWLKSTRDYFLGCCITEKIWWKISPRYKFFGYLIRPFDLELPTLTILRKVTQITFTSSLRHLAIFGHKIRLPNYTSINWCQDFQHFSRFRGLSHLDFLNIKFLFLMHFVWLSWKVIFQDSYLEY